MDNRFKDIADWFENLNPQTLDSLGTVYASDTFFRDPFNEIRGCEGVRQVYQHMFDTLEQPRFSISEIIEKGSQAFMVWRFDFTLRAHAVQIQGCTHFILNEAGLISHHRDYWDAAEELYEKIPVLGGLLRLLKRRIAVKP